MSYAGETETSVEKTRAELESTLGKFGADAFGYMTDSTRAMVQFRANGKYVRFLLPLPAREEQRFTHAASGGRVHCLKLRSADGARKAWEQACRSAWRALFLSVKAKLVAVEAGIATFEEEFLARLVMPNGETVGEMALPMVEQAYRDAKMPVFALALPGPGGAV